MPLPDAIPPFARIADERFHDARVLLEQGRTTGAVYLAGYVVECTLKSILIKILPQEKVKGVYDQFRTKGHDIGWLKRQLITHRLRIPGEIEGCLANLKTESVALRYNDQAIDLEESKTALSVAGTVLEWGKLMELQIVELNSMVRRVNDLLVSRYKRDHPDAIISVYAIPDEIRIRIVDEAFQGIPRMDRSATVWPLLEELPQEVRMYVDILLLITPEERELSYLSMEFDDPTRGLL